MQERRPGPGRTMLQFHLAGTDYSDCTAELTGARLGMSAGLHQISSSVWQPPKYFVNRQQDLGSLMRQRAYILGPPADAIELGERIWAL